MNLTLIKKWKNFETAISFILGSVIARNDNVLL